MPSDLKEHETRFLLAGRLWEVVEVDAKRHIVYVQQATSGKPTIWSGSAVPIHHRVRTKMAEILSSDQTFPYLRESGAEILQSLRTERATRKLGVGDRAVVISGNKL